MTSLGVSGQEKAIKLSQNLLEKLFGGGTSGAVAIRHWDGTLWPDGQPGPATLVLKHPSALRSMLPHPQNCVWPRPFSMMIAISKATWRLFLE